MYNTLSKLIGVYLPNSRIKSFHCIEFTASKKSFLWGIFFFSYQTSIEKALKIVFPLNLRNHVFIVSSILVFTMFSVFIANCWPSKGVTEERSRKCSKLKRAPWNYLISLFNKKCFRHFWDASKFIDLSLKNSSQISFFSSFWINWKMI